MYLFIVKELLREYNPDVYNKIIELSIPDEIWVFKWFQTLFSLILPLEIIIRIWDCVFAFGLEFSLKIIVTLVSFFEQKILKINDLEEFLNAFSIDLTDEKEVLYFRERLVTSAQNLVISETLLIHLKNLYEKNSNF